MAEIVELMPNGMSLLQRFLDENKDQIESFIVLLDFKDQDGVLLDSGMDIKTLCYMSKVLDTYITEELHGETENLN